MDEQVSESRIFTDERMTQRISESRICTDEEMTQKISESRIFTDERMTQIFSSSYPCNPAIRVIGDSDNEQWMSKYQNHGFAQMNG